MVEAQDSLHAEKIYSQILSVDARGNVLQSRTGPHTKVNTYDPATGRLLTSKVTLLLNFVLMQDLAYSWDVVGNLTQRKDTSRKPDGSYRNLTENFAYDAVNRLTLSSGVAGRPDLILTYDGLGNIKSKSDVGTYTYNYAARSHAVTAAGGTTYSYDADRNRFKRKDVSASGTTTTRYVGDTVLTTNSSTGLTSEAYVLRDHLGSANLIVDQASTVLQNQSFDAFGQRRDNVSWQPLTGIALTGFNTSITRRGYTGHEGIDALGLIHMNGRVYDARLGRFIQADPTIDGVTSTQGFNRYSYVQNNPLNAADCCSNRCVYVL